MMKSQIQILSAGIITIQDAGRADFVGLGIPTSGAWDRNAYARLMGLLGTEGSAGSALECLAGDLAIEADNEVLWAWTGPAIASLNGSLIPAETVATGRGRISLERTGPGPIYFATPGLQVPTTLDSTSTDTHSGLGPRPLHAGDILSTLGIVANEYAQVGAFIVPPPTSRDRAPLRVVSHTPELAQWLTHHEWKVASISRAGIRCERSEARATSEPPPHIPHDLLSYPTLPGLIQMPSADEIIILGPDCGTSGGYATAGTLISADIATPAYCAVGGLLGFTRTDLRSAVATYERSTRTTTFRSIGAISTELIPAGLKD